MKIKFNQYLRSFLVSVAMINFVGCVGEVNDRGVNISSSYEVLSSYIESWQIVQPTYKISDKPDTEKQVFKMKLMREESVKAAEKCEKAKDQTEFNGCVKSAYDSFPVSAMNLENYIKTGEYKALNIHPELRKLLNQSKKDGKIINGEFQKIIKKNQELLILDYEKQYQQNIANL